MAKLGHDRLQLFALRQTQADPAIARQIAGASQYQVADHGQAHESFTVTTKRDAKPCTFRQAADNQHRPRVEAEAEHKVVDDTGGDRQDIFTAPPTSTPARSSVE